MKPKHKIIILICSIIFGILFFIAFKFINNYLLNSNSSANFDKNINTYTPIIVCNVKGVYGENNIDSDLAPLNLLKDSDIEWITKKGGLHSEKTWAVLYPEKDDEKIVKIINLIKSCSDTHKSTNDELDLMDTRNGYPIDIVIKMKDGSQFSLKSAMKLTTTKKDDKGTEIHGTKFKDRFLMAYEKGSSTEYYTVYSNAATAYILDSYNPDFPKVDEFKITPENVNYGDKVSVSGGGCTENEVDIILSNANSTEEEYIIGKVKPVYGEWHWEGEISKNTKTYDGKDINFKSEKYFIGIKVGDSISTIGNPIIFAESDKASEGSYVSKKLGPEVVNNLKTIEIVNMNSDNNSKVNLKLPGGWYATNYIYHVAPEFRFNAEKNRKIKKTYTFNIHKGKDTSEFDQYGINRSSGMLEVLGYYRDQPEKTRFPNHSMVKSKVFSGKTILGQGEIFILECDIPDELVTGKNTKYDMVYAWIPIENESLAYNLTMSVPLGEKNDDYIQIVKKMLEIE